MNAMQESRGEEICAGGGRRACGGRGRAGGKRVEEKDIVRREGGVGDEWWEIELNRSLNRCHPDAMFRGVAWHITSLRITQAKVNGTKDYTSRPSHCSRDTTSTATPSKSKGFKSSFSLPLGRAAFKCKEGRGPREQPQLATATCISLRRSAELLWYDWIRPHPSMDMSLSDLTGTDTR